MEASVCGHTLYAVMMVTFIPAFPLMVKYVHLPKPNGSTPRSMTHDVQLLGKRVRVPPG